MVKKETKEVASKTVKKEKTEIKAEIKPAKSVAVKPTAKPKDPAVAVKPKAKPAKSKPALDTGSVDFQVQNFTDKIQVLSLHLKKHPHDFDSRRGLLIMVGKRRRLLNYCKKKDVVSYEKLTAALKLKK